MVQGASGNTAQFTNGANADLLISLTAGVSLITPATGILALGTTSTERMRINSSGNIGIGTTTYTARLFVSGSSTASTPTMVVREGVVSPTDGAGAFDVQNSAGTSLLFVSGSGRVGVNASTSSNLTNLFTVNQSASTTNGTPGTYGFMLSNQGTLRLSLGNDGTYSLIQTWNNNPLFVNPAGNNIVLGGGGANVGIGTTVMSDRLAVNGSMSVTGSALPGTDNLYDLGSSSKRWANVYATSISGSLTGSNVSAGQVVVAGTGGVLSGSNNFWWDNTNQRVGIGTSNPTAKLELSLTQTQPTIKSTTLILQGFDVNNTWVADNLYYNSVWRYSANNASGAQMYFTGGDIKFNTAGTNVGGADSSATITNRMTIKNAGNVGIGSDSPSQKLDVSGTIKTGGPGLGGRITFSRPDATGLEVGQIFNSGSSGLTIEQGGGGGFISFNVGTGGLNGFNPERVRFDASGNVGIGSTNPGATLDVGLSATNYIRANRTGTTGFFGFSLASNGTSVGVLGAHDTTGEVRIGSVFNTYYTTIYSGNAETIRVSTTGNVGIGTTIPTARLHVTGSSTVTDQTMLVRAGTPNQTGPVFEVENNLGATLLVVSGSGNVGIGTTNPGFNLEVNGTFAAVTKSFVIPHPLKSGWKLRYGSLEGPENGVYVRGQSDSETIELPDYWVPLVDESSITVQLTPIGKWQSLYVESIENNRVKIGRGLLMRLLGIKPAFFYTVTASRKDAIFSVEYDPSVRS